MAAARLAELLSTGFEFDPEDDDLIVHYLLPRLRGQRLPFDGVIVEADPFCAPPWELLENYGRKTDAFFFAAGKAKRGNDAHQKRACAGGGYWKGQKMKKSSVDGDKLVVPDTGEEIAWRKYLLNFHADGEQGGTGWVMDEYAVTAPTDLASSPSSVMAYHIRFTGHGQNSKKLKREPETQDSVADDQDGTTLPQLEDYALAAPPSEQRVMNSAAAFQESTDEADELLSYLSLSEANG